MKKNNADTHFEYEFYILAMQVRAVVRTDFVPFPDRRIPDLQNYGRVHLIFNNIWKEKTLPVLTSVKPEQK